MKRDIQEILLKWKNNTKNRKPIILRGARQVGKSWLAKDLGNRFDDFFEINFEKNPEFSTLFEGNFDVDEIIKNISNIFGKKIIEGQSLIFFDEIQICSKAITALRYFYEDMPNLHIIAAGSLLEFELENISVPVGRINFIHIYPMSFAEFLTASGKAHLRDLLLKNSKELKSLSLPLHEQLILEVKNYTLIGGMPEVVKEFLDSNLFENCISIQTNLLETYKSDFKKYAKNREIKYLDLLFNSVVFQIGQKFKYSSVSTDIKSRELGKAVDLLEKAGLIYKVYHSSSNGIPLKAEINTKKFKILFFDIGLTLRLLNFNYKDLILQNDISLVNKGAVAELFTGLELCRYHDFRTTPELYYWHKEKRGSNSEVDYVIEINNVITPIEVKSNKKGSMKSLQKFIEVKKSNVGIKISNNPYSLFNKIQTVPFYGIESLVK
ncbi:MAG: AAA family ATPase [Candidatus Delongbacteria bacterium]|jgi:predicted AAA+ superfamily ATPase|nr:AAA family ATPase [Candidatus Delongbacteria bacterium]